mgnify:FL=1
MYCTLCNKEEELGIELLGIKVCKACIEDISTTPIFTEKYDYYKEVIKVVLKNYIYERATLNPVR